MKLVFLVIASEDPINEQDLTTQKKTWATSNSGEIKVIWLRGYNGSDFIFDGETLFAPCLELYENILEKTILGVKYLLDHVEFDVLVRTNVSTYFNLGLTQAKLKNNSFRRDFYGGYIDKSKGGYFGRKKSQDYISGTGIFLSKNAAQELSKLDFKMYRGIPDDVAISHFLELSGIQRIRMPRNNLSSTHIFFPSYYIRAKSSSDSTLATRRMILIHDFFSRDKFIHRLRSYFQIMSLEIAAFKEHPESKWKYVQRNRVVFQNLFLSRKF